MTRKNSMSKGLRNRLKENLSIYQITIKELEEEKELYELSFPETVDFNLNFKINYQQSLRDLKIVIKKIKKHLGMFRAKDSGLILERKIKLEKQLQKLRKLREKRKLILKKTKLNTPTKPKTNNGI